MLKTHNIVLVIFLGCANAKTFLCRFCTDKYHPFDAEVQAKYVVGDDYLPTWKVPSLAKYYTGLGFGMKRSFDAWLRTQDKVCDIEKSIFEYFN